MGLQIYKPNKGNTGFCAHFTFNSKGDKKGVFVEIVKQNGWDASARGGQGNGIFKGGKKTTVKFSLAEVGEFIRALETNTDAAKAFHTPKAGSATITFARFKGKVQNKDTKKWEEGQNYTGWSLGISRTDDRYAISMTFGEGVMLREWLKFALEHVYSGIYSDDLKQAKEYAAKKEAGEKAEKPRSPKDFMNTETESSEVVSDTVEDDGLPF
jgi:hypothetical protein